MRPGPEWIIRLSSASLASLGEIPGACAIKGKSCTVKTAAPTPSMNVLRSTLTISLRSLMTSPSLSGGSSIGEHGEQEPDAGRQLGGRLLEQRVGGVVVGIAGGGVGDAPVNGLGVAGELRAHLAQPVAQADHPVETLV